MSGQSEGKARRSRERACSDFIFFLGEGLCRSQGMVAAPRRWCILSSGAFPVALRYFNPSRLQTVLLGIWLPQLPAPPLLASCCLRWISAKPRLA